MILEDGLKAPTSLVLVIVMILLPTPWLDSHFLLMKFDLALVFTSGQTIPASYFSYFAWFYHMGFSRNEEFTQVFGPV